MWNFSKILFNKVVKKYRAVELLRYLSIFVLLRNFFFRSVSDIFELSLRSPDIFGVHSRPLKDQVTICKFSTISCVDFKCTVDLPATILIFHTSRVIINHRTGKAVSWQAIYLLLCVSRRLNIYIKCWRWYLSPWRLNNIQNTCIVIKVCEKKIKFEKIWFFFCKKIV